MVFDKDQNRSMDRDAHIRVGGKVCETWDGETRTVSSIVSSDDSRMRLKIRRNGRKAPCDGIRFTRKFNYQYKHWCCCLAAILTFALVTTFIFYLGYNYFKFEPGSERIFRGHFTAIVGPNVSSSLIELEDSSSPVYERLEKHFLEGIAFAVNRSPLYHLPFLSAEILSLDGNEAKREVTAQFSLSFNPRLMLKRNPEDLRVLLVKSLQVLSRNFTIDDDTVVVEEETEDGTSWRETETISSHFATANVQGRTCVGSTLKFCRGALPTNSTTYPNVLGHKDLQDVMKDLITFRELIDGECYTKALDFVCHILQPTCDENSNMLLPCASHCREFWSGCQERLSPKLKEALDCSRFPKYSSVGYGCRAQPGCKEELLESEDTKSRICDGIPDCPNLEDEEGCAYCSSHGQSHCGFDKSCVGQDEICDGSQDCPDGSDEAHCLSLIPTELPLRNNLNWTRQKYEFPAGYLTLTDKGVRRKVCSANLANGTEDDGGMLRALGTSLCKTFAYKKLEEIKIIGSIEDGSSFVEISNPDSSDISFTPVGSCSDNRLLHVTCSNIESGVQSVRPDNSENNLDKTSKAGDWPWHAALFKDGIHVCDGTLLSNDWILTSGSCFQGQNRAEWIAKLGAIRAHGKSPWQQERYIQGMVKSPVEGSAVVAVKLNAPAIFSNFVRPARLPSYGAKSLYCNTLGWSTNGRNLRRVQVQETKMENCANKSIITSNAFCYNSLYEESCQEDEMTGNGMYCLVDGRWVLYGVSNWRIACSMDGMQRPRLYDKIITNVKWIQNVLSSH